MGGESHRFLTSILLVTDNLRGLTDYRCCFNHLIPQGGVYSWKRKVSKLTCTIEVGLIKMVSFGSS